MAKLRSKEREGRQPAGKQPTRVPIRTTSPVPPKTKSNQCHALRMEEHPKRSSSHSMKTRSQTKSFRFMDLPPEIRSLIYAACVTKDEHPTLGDFKLPRLLAVSQVLRSEALPVFFATETFTVSFRSNWCVRNKHFHGPGYIRHKDSGVVDLSPYLRDGKNLLPTEAVRFHNVDFTVKCVCCIKGIKIGQFQLRVAERKALVHHSVTTSSIETKKVWSSMIEDLESKVQKIGAREYFNGFTIDDIKDVGMSFKCDSGLQDDEAG